MRRYVLEILDQRMSKDRGRRFDQGQLPHWIGGSDCQPTLDITGAMSPRNRAFHLLPTSFSCWTNRQRWSRKRVTNPPRLKGAARWSKSRAHPRKVEHAGLKARQACLTDINVQKNQRMDSHNTRYDLMTPPQRQSRTQSICTPQAFLGARIDDDDEQIPAINWRKYPQVLDELRRWMAANHEEGIMEEDCEELFKLFNIDRRSSVYSAPVRKVLRRRLLRKAKDLMATASPHKAAVVFSETKADSRDSGQRVRAWARDVHSHHDDDDDDDDHRQTDQLSPVAGPAGTQPRMPSPRSATQTGHQQPPDQTPRGRLSKLAPWSWVTPKTRPMEPHDHAAPKETAAAPTVQPARSDSSSSSQGKWEEDANDEGYDDGPDTPPSAAESVRKCKLDYAFAQSSETKHHARLVGLYDRFQRFSPKTEKEASAIATAVQNEAEVLHGKILKWHKRRLEAFHRLNMAQQKGGRHVEGKGKKRPEI
ncbi:hypothetical protein IWZ03DRAFT_121774 [Phyllosticta citriasiana]|uniref:Uncharacterized protein n=1 Tax=Phyllosticta citriasiana TaxID=595635 RepID=A0ABR1K7E2_9PEZI